MYACQGHPGEGMRFRSIQAKVAVLSLVQLGISSLFAGIAHSYPTDCNELRELYWKKKNLALDYRIEEVQLLKLIRYETTKKDQDLQCTRMEELGLGREEWARRLSSCKSVYDALAVLNDKMDGLCPAPLKLSHQFYRTLPSWGGWFDGSETVFRRRYIAIAA